MRLRLVVLFTAQLFDAGTFQTMIARHGSAAEANPLVASLYLDQGVLALFVVKALLVVVVGSLAIAAMRRPRNVAWAFVGGLPVALAITAGMIGGISNAAAILA